MSSPEDKLKRIRRRENHIAKDLRSPKFKHKVIEDKDDLKKITTRNVNEFIEEEENEL